MRQHFGVVVVVYQPGVRSPFIRSQLRCEGFQQFRTDVIGKADRRDCEGVAANVNLYDEAVRLMNKINTHEYLGGLRAEIVQEPQKSWEVRDAA